MEQLGVPASAIVQPPESVDNTGQEANMLRAMAQERHWRRVIIVTSKYHTRRTGFAFRRGLEGTGAVPDRPRVALRRLGSRALVAPAAPTFASPAASG
jgi:uncharacterized SAM-binding protein YcdF (DUF218 family)